MLRVIMLLMILLGSAALAVAQVVNRPPMIMNCPGYAPYLRHYQPEVITTLDKLPIAVAENIKAYLLARVGEPFFKTLTFAGGHKVNLSKEDSAQLGVSGYHWKLAVYYVRFNCLTVQNPDGSYFEAGASFNTRGSVVDSVNLPPLSTNGNSTIIPANEAVRTGRANWSARRNWIKQETLFLNYSPLNRSFVWWFSESHWEKSNKSRERRLFMDATTGVVIRKRNDVMNHIPF